MTRKIAEVIIYEGDDWDLSSPDTHIFTIGVDERGHANIHGDPNALSTRGAAKVGLAMLKFALGELTVTPAELVLRMSAVGDGSQGEYTRTQKNERAGFVYVLHSNGVYKIGHARVVDKRIEQISPALPYPVELEIALSSEDRFALERELHERYANKRLGGEWFALSNEDLFELGVRK